ncbi:MAG: radical SAM family heme chaperone HemW [Ignavibacteria bacterium]
MRPDQKAGIYIHIPFCRRKCNYCDFYLITNQKLIEKFLWNLSKEIYLISEVIEDIHFETLFIGGGTPSLLEASQLEQIINLINKYYHFNGIEITIETNPEDLYENPSLIKDLRSIGINRLSIGIQSFSNKELKFLSRMHTASQGIAVIEQAFRYFDNVSIDLIYSLPEQNKEDVIYSLQQAVLQRVPHISAYTLIFEENTRLYLESLMGRIIRNADEHESELYLTLSEFLTDNNYEHYEVSNYSKEGYKSKHNLKYWLGGDYIGLGPSSHSLIRGHRWNNYKNIVKYNLALAENKLPRENIHKLSKKERKLEYIMLHLRSTGIELKEYKEMFKLDFLVEYKKAVEFILNNNLGNCDSAKFYLNTRGYALLDEILVEYF